MAATCLQYTHAMLCNCMGRQVHCIDVCVAIDSSSCPTFCLYRNSVIAKFVNFWPCSLTWHFVAMLLSEMLQLRAFATCNIIFISLQKLCTFVVSCVFVYSIYVKLIRTGTSLCDLCNILLWIFSSLMVSIKCLCDSKDKHYKVQ